MSRLTELLYTLFGAGIGGSIAFAYADQTPTADFGTLRLICSAIALVPLLAISGREIRKHLRENP